MKKLRKMLGDVNASSVVALRELIDTQSKDTIRKWCLDYATEKILPIFEKHCPDDSRPRNAVNAAHEYLDGKVKFPVVKNVILNECHAPHGNWMEVPLHRPPREPSGRVRRSFTR